MPSIADLTDTMVTVPEDPHGVELAMRVVGPEDGPRLLLVHGLGAQLVTWPAAFVDALVDRGLRVAAFDNRDAGRSTVLEAPRIQLPAILAGDHSSITYGLEALAGDAFAVMDHLSWDRAHVAGASMGGMVVQRMTLDRPERIASLTSIMSTPHAQVGVGTPEAIEVLLKPPPATRDEHLDATVAAMRVIGSRTHPRPEDELRADAGLEWDRGKHAAGTGRQFGAIQVAPDRREALGSVTTPTLVIHGDEDTLIQPEGGIATARAVPGARLELVEGMGHDLPAPLHDHLVDLLVGHVHAAERADG